MSVSAQKLAPGKYWIQFTDKHGSSFSADRPEEFLSLAAIERRMRYNIPVTDQDIPVLKKYVDSLYYFGFEVLGTSKWFNAAVIASDDTTGLLLIENLSFVKNFCLYSSSDDNFEGNLSLEEEKAVFEPQGIHYKDSDLEYGLGNRQITILNGKALHDLGYKGRGIKIALLDAGFFNTDKYEVFSHLWNDNRILSYKDFVNIHNSDFFRENTHGMSVLSVIAAFSPGTLIGTAPEAEYILLRTEDSSSEFRIEEANWLIAAEYADSAGADIISTSLGYSEFNDSVMNYTYDELDGKTALVTRAAELAFSKGMIVIASAGNEGDKKWKKITAPSDGENVLAVGSIDSTGTLSSFSSRGPSSDGRIKPDVLAVGYETSLINSSGYISKGFGTSYAAPQISGLTACLWQAHPDKSNKEIIQAIRRSSSRYINPDNNYGYGIPDFILAFHNLFDYEEYTRKIWIFPNPFNESFNLYFDINITEIQIIDLYGKVIWADKIEINPFELKNIIPSGLLPGIYILMGKNKDDYRITRIINQ